MHRTSVVWLSVFSLGVVALMGSAGIAAAGGHQRPLGDSEVIAELPFDLHAGDTGFPEGMVLRKNTLYVASPAAFGTAGMPPSRIYAFDVKTGALLREYTIRGEDTTQQHGMSSLAFDEDGRLYALVEQLGIVRIDVNHGGRQEVYATFADLPMCAGAPKGTPCSPTAADLPPLVNDFVFDEDGSAYVTDSFQATIWRVPAGGGAAVPWLSDASLDGAIGPNGIRLTPDHKALYVVTTVSGPNFGTPGHLYKVPLKRHPKAADMELFHTYDFEGPDDFAVGRSGRLYVSLALSSEISVLDKHGNEVTRYGGSARYPSGMRPAVPWDAPATITFDDRTRSLLVTNHAEFSGIPSHFVVFDVYVDDTADPLVEPDLDCR